MAFCGIDVSSQTLDSRLLLGTRTRHRRFNNDEGGWEALHAWGASHGVACFALEATGPYHKGVLRFLQAKEVRVVCLNPLRARQLAMGLGFISKDDKVDALVLARAAEMMVADAAAPRSRVHEEALEISRRIEQVQIHLSRERTRLKEPRLSCIVEDSIRRSIAVLRTELEVLERDWLTCTRADEALWTAYQFALGVPQIGPKTARVLVSEVPPKEHIRDRKSAAALSGTVPARRRSGTSLHAPDRIVKGCNTHIKRALYMPAVQALRRSPELKDFYMRLIDKGKHPKQAIAAIMRKIFARFLSVHTRATPWKSLTT